MSKEEAFKNTVECITGPITKIISTKGIDAVYKSLNDADKKIFMTAYQVNNTNKPTTLLRFKGWR